MQQMKMFTRNVVFLLNFTGWLLVFYFSVYNDKLAASLSYVSITLTVLTMNYIFREMREIESMVHFIDIASQILIVRGFSLIVLSPFWNTAFYAICLGILIQSVKNELLSRVSPDFDVQESTKATSNDSLEEFKSCSQLQNLSQDMIRINGNKIGVLNKPEHCNELVNTDEKNDFPVQYSLEINDIEVKRLKEFIREIATSSNETLNKTGNLNKFVKTDKNGIPVQNTLEIDDIKTKQLKEFIKENIKNSDKSITTFELDISQTACDHWENVITPDKKSVQRQNENSIETDKSVLICNGNLSLPNSDLKNAEDKIREIVSLRTLPVKVINLQEFSLSEYVKINSKPKLDETNVIVKEEKSNEINTGTPEKQLLFNGETIIDSLSENGLIGLYSAFTRMESIVEPEKTKSKLFHHQLNNSSNVSFDNSEDVNEKCDFINSCDYANLSRQKHCIIKPEADLEVLHHCESYIDLHVLDESTNMDLGLQHKEKNEEIDTANNETDVDKFVMKVKNLQRKDPLKIKENSAFERKYASVNCTSLKTINVQSENEMCANQMKCISSYVENASLKKTSEGNDFKLDSNSEKNLESKGLQDSFPILELEICSSKRNKSANHVEERILKEFRSAASRNASVTNLPNASIVEDVVNRIDLGFIYALGSNVP